MSRGEGALPRIAALILLAAAIALAIASRQRFDSEAIVQGLIALALLASAAFLPWLVRRFRQRAGTSQPGASEVSWIEAPELDDRLMRGPPPAVLDVRGPDEFTGELGHIAGARNIPLADLLQRVDEIDRLKTGSVVLVCKTQMRSAKAAGMLKETGFRDVSVLRGGMVEWRRQQRPVEGSSIAKA
jgi:rhodanese-related sulfurtransferase